MSVKKIIIVFGSVVIVTALLFGGIFLLISNNSTKDEVKGIATQQGGSQKIGINAKGGYSPKISTAQANVPILLEISTKSTFDCSSGFRIPQLGISKQLPSNGTTEIQIPAQASGSVINFTCTMGMYSGQIQIS